MIIGKNFFITEFGKTGTTFLREYFKQYQDVKLTVHHDFIGKENINLLEKPFRVTTVRNPLVWYVSLWKWSCKIKKKSPLYSDLISKRVKLKRLKVTRTLLKYLYAQIFKNNTTWKNLFTETDSKRNFNIWLKKMLDEKSKLELGSDYSFTVPNNLGYMTFQFLIRNCLKDDLNILYDHKNFKPKHLDFLFQKKFVNYTLKTENLIDDLKFFLKRINLDILNMNQLENYQPTDKTDEYIEFYEDDTKKLVLSKDEIIFKNFYPDLIN